MTAFINKLKSYVNNAVSSIRPQAQAEMLVTSMNIHLAVAEIVHSSSCKDQTCQNPSCRYIYEFIAPSDTDVSIADIKKELLPKV